MSILVGDLEELYPELEVVTTEQQGVISSITPVAELFTNVSLVPQLDVTVEVYIDSIPEIRPPNGIRLLNGNYLRTTSENYLLIDPDAQAEPLVINGWLTSEGKYWRTSEGRYFATYQSSVRTVSDDYWRTVSEGYIRL